jgi:hypothetical protein
MRHPAAAKSIVGDDYDRDHNECREQRKSAIQRLRAWLCCIGVRHHDLMYLPGDHAPVLNLVSDSFFVAGADGALQPYDSLVDPIIVVHRIGFCFLATD